MNTWTGFNSILAESIRRFLQHKRALGKRYQREEDYLRLFDRYLHEHQVATLATITPAVIDAFLASRPYTAKTYNANLGLLHRLFDWLVLHDVLPLSPVTAQRRPKRPAKRPFIFNRDQVQQLLSAAAQLSSDRRFCHRAETYRLGFLLMYGLGLRTGEVIRLCRQDIDHDRQLLVIRQTKFSKDRWVPFGPKIGAEIAHYLRQSEQQAPDLQPEHPLLTYHRDKKRPMFRKALSRCFHTLIPQLDLAIPTGVEYPRAHHLRHSFAVGVLLRWYREGINPADRLIYLSTFMGHVDPTSTAVYLTITTELLQEANRRFEHFASPLLQEVTS